MQIGPRALLALVFLGLGASAARAQLPVPRLNSIFPCGAQRGTTVECTLAGGDLEGATGLYFSHKGITAQPAGKDKFKVTVGNDVPVGRYDVRVVTPLGLSGFRAFLVGDRPEFIEKEPNNEPAQANRVTLPVTVNGVMNGGTDIDCFVFAAKKGERVILNCRAWRIDSKLDGTMMLYDAGGKEMAYSGDYYGKDPFIDVTIPEDGDYTVKLWDFTYESGSDLFYRLDIGALPHIDAVVPAAVRPGEEAVLTVYGRNLPGGKPAPGLSIAGRPLEMITRTIKADSRPEVVHDLHTGETVRPDQSSLDGMEFRIETPAGVSNAAFLAFTPDPVVVEAEPNNDIAHAQRVPVPCDITGTFSPVGDVDVYAFTLKKGESVVAEVFGERQSILPDPFLVGMDAKGKRLTSVDDNGKNIGQIRFTTNTRDARWDFTAPADGEYFVQVRDLYSQQRGDPRFTYRLSLRKKRPDFRLIAVPNAEILPDSTVVRKGGREKLDVLVFRNDGFEDAIRIEARRLPAGVTCEPVTVGPGKTSVPLVFTAAKDAPVGHAEIDIVGTAEIDGKNEVRIARGGGLTWSTVNTPGIARMAASVVLAVRDAPPFSLTAVPEKTSATAGDKVAVAVKLERAGDWAESAQLSGFDMPQGVNVALVTIAKGAAEGKVVVELPANLKPGTYSFVVQGAGQVPKDYASPKEPPPAADLKADPKKPAPKTEPKKPAGNVRVLFPSNPITLTVAAAPKADPKAPDTKPKK